MLKDWFKERTGSNLNLDNPKTLNEKIQWIKLNDLDDLKSRLTDKYAVRDWVKEKIGEKYLIPLLGVYERPEDINWDVLPKEFVIKCNHGCGWNIIVKDKNTIDRDKIGAQLNRWLNTTYGINSFELQYFKIPPKLHIEKKLENKANEGLVNYRFWCFNGKVEFIQFHTDKYFTENVCAFYSTSWVKQNFSYNHPVMEQDIEKPVNIKEMMGLAQTLCKGFKLVRVDLYQMNDGTIYFGEMTFTPCMGIGEWYGQDMGVEFGNMLKL